MAKETEKYKKEDVVVESQATIVDLETNKQVTIAEALVIIMNNQEQIKKMLQ
jgi:hypothetical protein